MLMLGILGPTRTLRRSVLGTHFLLKSSHAPGVSKVMLDGSCNS